MMRLPIVLATLALFACGTPPAPAQTAAPGPLVAIEQARAQLEAIERRTGGRLGVMLIDGSNNPILAHRADERFAMCSTFKLPLAAMLLEGAERERWSLDDRLPLARADLVSNSPVSERHVAAGFITIGDAAEAIVTVSDNTAANLLLRHVGGPEAFTQWLRGNLDQQTRLDRFELALNENRPGDPRDTTTPRAMAGLMARFVIMPALRVDSETRLRGWTADSRTGLRRIRAGLPAGWAAGDKTGSCGTAWNDVAWFTAPNGRDYALAVYLDRPTVQGPEAEAAIAEVARLAGSAVQ